MDRTVLVTGAARQLSGRFVRQVRRHPAVSRVIAVDTRAPGYPLGEAEFVRADIRQPSIVSALAAHAVDTVVHLDLGPAPGPTGGRAAAKERNVLGTLQLLGACQKLPTLRRLVIGSSTQVYGHPGRGPAVLDEDAPPTAAGGGGFAQDVAEIEEYVRGFARRRPEVAVTVLRFAHLLGAGVDSPFAAYFRLPVLPTVLGYDPRLQFLHEHDALEVLGRAVAGPGDGAEEGEQGAALGPGTYNVAGEGVLLLSQAARRLGRPTVPVARPVTPWLGSALRAAGVRGVSAEQFASLAHGRVVRTARLRAALGGPLEYTTAAAFAEFAAAHGGPLSPEAVTRALDRVEEVVRRG
ncbi:NAD-dependent epimerase/dehydratase family protein [Streptomyces hoynatensis]|uniref:NAD-dependent epimerase/dehydratase family protein n=1 Tax=Streptomyces hoynatensis TaxID=1141874 RepID=A0A3A9Z3G7_9ACTN|nr:NAD-dependent epimerase/dehydratase family protein [Streptomyces hoynatensis]RKN41867.1 NAD-dependent epimerase/dehydratase family protein [Streptomyces hoynatensis]